MFAYRLQIQNIEILILVLFRIYFAMVNLYSNRNAITIVRCTYPKILFTDNVFHPLCHFANIYSYNACQWPPFQESLRRHQHLNDYEAHHNGNTKYGITKFSDLTVDEFKSKWNFTSYKMVKTTTINNSVVMSVCNLYTIVFMRDSSV